MNPTAPGAAEETVDVQAAARVLGLQTKIVNAATEADIYAAFAILSEMKPDALFITRGYPFFTYTDRIVALATHLGLPTSHYRREFVVAGGLMSYASTTDEVYRVLGGPHPQGREGGRLADPAADQA